LRLVQFPVCAGKHDAGAKSEYGEAKVMEIKTLRLREEEEMAILRER
jgi:hypothetical protein